jgi:SPP1 gp7 family putative phage head morphogenesis protein
LVFKKKVKAEISNDYFTSLSENNNVELENKTFFDVTELENIQNDLIERIYNGYPVEIIDPELFKMYNQIFSGIVYDNMDFKYSFEGNYQNTMWQQYMTNAFQFSGAKILSLQKVIQSSIFDENHQRKNYFQFKRDIQPYLKDTYNGTWLNTEYQQAVRGSVMGNKWNKMYNRRDVFPYWIYKTRRDVRVREEHKILDGKKFAFDDLTGQNIFPSNGWNCRCTAEYSDDPENLIEGDNVQSLMDTEIKNRKVVPDMFQANPGINGIFPSSKYAYDGVMPNIGNLNYSNFPNGSKGASLEAISLTQYQKELTLYSNREGLHGDIIFKNKKYHLNIRLEHKIINKINHVQNLKETIEEPDEIWATWENNEDQKFVNFTFINFDKKGKFTYFVETQRGIIVDAYLRKHIDSKDKRRTGLLLML